jgi:flagellar capping protein FliD
MFNSIAEFFTGSTVKYIAYLGIATMISIAGWKLYSVVHQHSMYKAEIAILQSSIDAKDERIASLQASIRLANELVASRDKALEQLDKQLDGITENLGLDMDAPAPAALKEYFRRLPK